MLRKCWVAVILTALLISAPTLAADYLTLSLYDANARIPGFLVPFKLSGVLFDQGSVVSVSTTLIEGSADCRAMKDPFLKNIILAKCSAPATIQLQLSVLKGGKLYAISQGPFEFKQPDGNLTVVPDPSDKSDQSIVIGQAIYNSRCLSCHQTPDSKVKSKGSTAAGIQSAINTVSAMSALKTMDSSNYAPLAAYLRSL